MTDVLNRHPYAGYLTFLQARLSPPRLAHSIGVMRVMEELANIYSLDFDQALTAGLVHDVAKDLTAERLLALAERVGYQFSHSCERLPVYLHAPVSALVVSQELGITETTILDAISAHSWFGDQAVMDTRLARCLRVADILAPIKEWHGMRKLRRVAYAGQIEEATWLASGWLIEYFHELGIPLHPALQANFNSLSAKLHLADSFLERS